MATLTVKRSGNKRKLPGSDQYSFITITSIELVTVNGAKVSTEIFKPTGKSLFKIEYRTNRSSTHLPLLTDGEVTLACRDGVRFRWDNAYPARRVVKDAIRRYLNGKKTPYIYIDTRRHKMQYDPDHYWEKIGIDKNDLTEFDLH